MAAETDTPGDVPSGTDVADAGSTEQRLERFSSVQVWVHGTIAVSIFVLYLTGLPMTFADHLGWLFTIFGYGNVVLLHVAAGVIFMVAGVYYLLYLVLSGLLTRRTLPAFPRIRDIREAIDYVRYIVGRGEKPTADKYTWLQKAEIWVLGIELLLLSVTGLLLWYRGLFVSPEFRGLLGGHEGLADVMLLIVRDIHVVVALTMLMGIAFHLYMVNVKERFPFNQTMFSGDVSASRAEHHWKDWANEKLDGSPGHDDTPTPSQRTLAGLTLGLLVFFAVVLISTLFAAVLSPLPTREYLIALPFDPLTQGAASIVFFVGLNVAVLVILSGIVAICYGLAKRLRGEYR